MSTITIDRALLERALEALEIGYDSAKAEADQYHAAMAGYRPQRHGKMDAEVQQIAAAITAVRAALAQEQAEPAQEPVSWMQPKTIDAHLRPDLGYETCSKTDYGAFPVYRAPLKAEPAQLLPCPTPETCREHCCGGWCSPEAIKAAEGGK